MFPRALAIFLLAAAAMPARSGATFCGTTRETPAERLFLHRARKAPRLVAPHANRDTGDLAIIEDTGGIVARQNEFNLDRKTLRFAPSGATYSYTVLENGFDADAATRADPLAALDDDDSRPVALPFAFPFYGAAWREVYVNSDGNLTFTAPDNASTNRSLGRMTSGPPRISPLFDDLDPSRTAGGVRVLAESARVVITWLKVPEYAASGAGAAQTFQARLFPDGRIEFAYAGVAPASALVGIAPGALEGGTALVDFRTEPSGAYSGAVAERFGNTLDIDIVTVAQRFYETHDDAYDYIAVFNNMDIPALPGGVIAYESTVRSRGAGYGAPARDDGPQYGSPSRLQAVLNMGPLSQYPSDPDGIVPARSQAGDTPLTTIGHEAGHLFLAYASITDPNDPAARPMLGYQNQHWAFTFNSEASLLEGERILDQGPGASPRFLTTDTVQQYSPLDQYLMGLRAPADVPDTFVVRDAPSYMQQWHPARGVAFDGARQNVAIADVIQAMGRRTPDHTLAQRRYRFAFVLVTAPGADPSAADLATLDNYRRRFEAFFAKASDGRASAETTLLRSTKLSLFPIAGIVQGLSAVATVSVQTPPSTPLPVALSSGANVALPASVTIAAGATSVAFPYSGAKAGVDEVTAVPGDPRYETAVARVQVAGPAELRLTQTSSEPLTVKLSDANGIVYSGIAIDAIPSAGGAVYPSTATTGAQGLATFRWNPGDAAVSQLRLTLSALPAVSLIVRAGAAVPFVSTIVNAASGVPGFAPGALASIYGAHLAGTTVAIDGAPATILYGSDTQINFYAPPSTATGAATVTVTAPSGETASAPVSVAAVQPGIFGALVSGGTLVVYVTGIGAAPIVFLGATPLHPAVTKLSPGVSQLTAPIPAGISGPQSVLVSSDLAHSNTVRVTIP